MFRNVIHHVGVTGMRVGSLQGGVLGLNVNPLMPTTFDHVEVWTVKMISSLLQSLGK